VTNNDGRWAIELASTIYTPAAEIGQVYNDAIEANLRRGRDWMLGYSLRDQALLNSTRRPGKTANIVIYGPRERAGAARSGNPMAGYVTKGVTSRLRLAEVTAAQIAGADANLRGVRPMGRRRRGRVGLHDEPPGRPGAACKPQQGPHPFRLHPLH
jgi:hypothetical protein